MKKYIKIIIITLLILIIDITTKALISNLLTVGKSIEIIKNIFNFTLAHNYGAAWSILDNKIIFLVTVSIFTLLMLIYIIKKEQKLTKLNTIYYGLIIGGILGNLINRIFLGYVIDFLDFNIFGYNFPIFNIADIAIVISIILMIIEVIKTKEEK